MWNNYRMLNFIANLLLAAVVVTLFYILNMHYLKLSFLPLNEISIKGMYLNDTVSTKLQHVTREQIKEIARNEITGNFLTVDLTAIRQSFEKLSWVRSAVVHRNWYAGLEVLLEEHTPLARWHDSALVNTYGEIYHATIDKKLPVFIGPTKRNVRELVERYHSFNKILKPLQQSIAEIYLSPRHAWRLRLETGMVLKLGHTEMESRLARYQSVYDQNIKKLRQLTTFNYLDLRYSNGFSIRIPGIIRQTPTQTYARKET